MNTVLLYCLHEVLGLTKFIEKLITVILAIYQGDGGSDT